MIVKTIQFSIELAWSSLILYPYKGKLDTVNTSKGMTPFYYFCDDVRKNLTIELLIILRLVGRVT